MSRRRPVPRPRSDADAWRRVTIKCDGTTKVPHARQRVATVRVRRVDDSWWVRVEYGGLGEPESSTGAFRGDHLTRRFPCKACGADVPVTDEKLAPIVARHGSPVLLLGELSSRLSE